MTNGKCYLWKMGSVEEKQGRQVIAIVGPPLHEKGGVRPMNESDGTRHQDCVESSLIFL